MKKLCTLSVLIIGTLLLSAAPARAAFVPATLSYQGSLNNADGTPFNGLKDITFRLYTTATGTAFWSETQLNVFVLNGRFAAVLGNNASNPLDISKFTTDVWLGLQVVGEAAEMTPRNKLTSVAFAFKADNGVPVGGIIMWSGSVPSIPDGWALCDGANGTPNLRGRFIVGAANIGEGVVTAGTGTNLSQYGWKAAGGEERVTLTLSEIPSHNHAQNGYQMLHYNGVSTVSGFTDNSSNEPNLIDNGVAPASQGGGGSHNNLPPYYALAYIMRLR
jgi:microcystin-dependent protein